MRVADHLWSKANFGYGQVVPNGWRPTQRFQQLLKEADGLRAKDQLGEYPQTPEGQKQFLRDLNSDLRSMELQRKPRGRALLSGNLTNRGDPAFPPPLVPRGRVGVGARRLPRHLPK
jgi:hypothetical protein